MGPRRATGSLRAQYKALQQKVLRAVKSWLLPHHSTVPGNLESLKVIKINLAKETPIDSKFYSLVMRDSFKVLGLSSTSVRGFNRILKIYCPSPCFHFLFSPPLFFNSLTKPCLRICRQTPGDSWVSALPCPSLWGSAPFLRQVLQCLPPKCVHFAMQTSLGFIGFVISASEAGNHWCEHTFKKHNFVEPRVCNSVNSGECFG